MRQGGKNYSDMGHSLFFNSTCDVVENKRQGHATLPFLKFDMRHWGPPSRGPLLAGIEVVSRLSATEIESLWLDMSMY